MSTFRDPFPDIETALVNGLPPLLVVPGGGTVSAGTTTPSNLDARLPFLRVTLVEDPDDGVTRQATVDIDIFGGTRAVAYALGEQTRGLMLSLRRLDGVTIDRVLTVSGPKRVPWDNTNIRRVLATYRISTRR